MAQDREKRLDSELVLNIRVPQNAGKYWPVKTVAGDVRSYIGTCTSWVCNPRPVDVVS